MTEIDRYAQREKDPLLRGDAGVWIGLAFGLELHYVI